MHVLDPDRTDHSPGPEDDIHDDATAERVTTADRVAEHDDVTEHDDTDHDDTVIDLAADEQVDDAYADDGTDEVNIPPKRGLVRVRGMRVKRVRIWSVAKIAAVFFALGYAAVLATAVLTWAIANQIGVISSIEDTAVTSLGLETFQIAGAPLFQVFAVITGILTLFGYVITLLLAVIYNAAGSVFGGVAVETGPLRRPRRVFSLRHRRFVTVS